jgi:hypothetical protein
MVKDLKKSMLKILGLMCQATGELEQDTSIVRVGVSWDQLWDRGGKYRGRREVKWWDEWEVIAILWLGLLYVKPYNTEMDCRLLTCFQSNSLLVSSGEVHRGGIIFSYYVW